MTDIADDQDDAVTEQELGDHVQGAAFLRRQRIRAVPSELTPAAPAGDE
jgi:hypothetical protein